MNDNCEMYDTKDSIAGGDQSTRFALEVWLGTLVTWLFVFLAISNGVNSQARIIWWTVTIPTFLVFLMFLRGLTLPNADKGFRMYLFGEGFQDDEDLTWLEKLSKSGIWVDAVSQILFSTGVCQGLLTSYASYKDKESPIIKPALIVGIGNSAFSCFAGFAVFSYVGYLIGLNSPAGQ